MRGTADAVARPAVRVAPEPQVEVVLRRAAPRALGCRQPPTDTASSRDARRRRDSRNSDDDGAETGERLCPAHDVRGRDTLFEPVAAVDTRRDVGRRRVTRNGRATGVVCQTAEPLVAEARL